MPTRTDDRVRCSFCGKTQDQVRKLIAGSKNVFICDECIELCGEILAEELEEEEEKEPVSQLAGINLLKPKEIKGISGRVCHWTGCSQEGTVCSGLQPLQTYHLRCRQ